MRYLIALILSLIAAIASAQAWEDQKIFAGPGATISLRVISSTDTQLFAPLLRAFVTANPDVTIEYLVTGTADIDQRLRKGPAAYDIVISSAMDLQLKLTNDGFALALANVTHPDWAQWRQSLFAFTSEPAAIVINRAAFDGHAIPQSRQDLIEALRARPEVFRNRVGTYDVRKSGLGYLFATQDARASETFWRLMEVMGSLNARLYCCSGDMIDDLSEGTIAVAYNVLGSYAQARARTPSVLEIILPSDFPTTMMRTAFVSKSTPRPEAAERFIQHLLSHQARPQDKSGVLPSLRGRADGADRATIPLEPALLTFLDSLKRQKFLSEWESALIQN